MTTGVMQMSNIKLEFKEVRPDDDKYAAAKAQAEAEKQVRQLGFDALTARQKTTVRRTFNVLQSVHFTLSEDNDMWLSDIKELKSCMYAIRNQFNLGGCDHVYDEVDEE
jgi:hypothetical protein